MAQKKSTADILRDEKYMDDAAFSALFNLTKAAKRKSEYVWSPQKFNSLDSIWGDPIELESNKVLDDASKVSKSPKYESKVLQRQYCGTDNKQSTSQVYECHPVVVMPDNARKSELHPEQMPKVYESRKSSLLPNFVDNNEGKINKSIYLSTASKESKANEQYDSRIKRETVKRKPEIDFRISDPRYERSQEISQRKQNFSGIGTLRSENHSQHNFGDPDKISRLTSFKNSSKFNVASNAEKNESHNSETEFQTSCIKSKLKSSDKPQKEKETERVKRKKYVSSSVNCLLPEQKHISIDNQKHDTADKRIMLKTMLELKLFKGDKVFNFTLELSDLNRLKKRFPKLAEVLPETDGDEKELNYSADAAKIVLGFLRNLRYPTPDDERTAVEVLAASKSWEMNKFHNEFKQKFSENLNKNNVRLAYGAAVHYGLTEICDAYKCVLGDDLPSKRPYRPRKCYVSVSTYVEPREFCIPSKIATSTLNDNFDRDIKNELKFKAIVGSYVITGFHILLDIDNETETDQITLEFFCVVRNVKSSLEEQFKIRKPLRRNIVIHLKKSLVVNQDETAEIVVESSIKPYLCFAVKENNFVERCDESLFSLNVTSNYRVQKSNEKRFLIEKLLYYPKT